jgi:hypothetical protein
MPYREMVMKSKEENKYYTPSIEEFHVGFEFEVNYGAGTDSEDWEKESLNKSPQVVTLPYMRLENIRVKYLDREDIESLGYKLTEEFPDAYHLKDALVFKGKGLIVFHPIMNRLLFKYPNYIRDASGNYNGFQTMFSGTIKNKSELKQVLKQIGV